MTEVWKMDNVYVLYTENKKVMNRIKRSYHDFELMADYQKDGKVFARQYKIPLQRKRSAFHLAKVE